MILYMFNCCMKCCVEEESEHINYEERQNEYIPKRSKHAPTTMVMHDKSLIEFPLEKGLTRFDYCPLRCTICLMGILKKDAKAGPCVTHVFHKDCIDKWSLYCIEKDQVASCPNCLQQYKS